ncbi:MAG TPA: mechanosensitive ion channel domain-containing protein [Pseudolabrys sp.]|nr:mechanosensitive ion channel domain-containing protein [Pseudolabrys sp.]
MSDLTSGLGTTGAAFLGGLLRALAAGLLLLVSVWILRRLRSWLVAKLAKTQLLTGAGLGGLGLNFGSHLVQAAQSVVRIVITAVIFVLGYVWVIYALDQFPSSAPWGQYLGTFLIDLLATFGRGALGALPGLVAVVIVIFIARWSVRLINVTFKEIDAGRILFPGIERETARTTQTLLIAAVWLFAVVVAYPYIPGSDTDAFKGLSVLVGLMITLGSTGLINQVINGLFVIYSRSVRPADYVRVGEIEGEVVNVGFLATKLRTPRQEEITIPHSVLVGTATTNYSRLAGDRGMVVTASVTIGYDVPWRKVHALLLLGAAETAGIRKEPPPRVLQRELSSFCVEYQLLAHLEEGQSRAVVLSELHAKIQDAFNEYDTQIMSPHFESQPDRKIIVPKTDWYSAPASPPLAAADGAKQSEREHNSR